METLQKIKKVVAYNRMSTERSAESDSPEHHRIRIREYCKWKELELMEPFYEDLAYSGGDNTRPAYLRLKTDIKNKRFDAVVVSRLDRLGRSTKELLDFSELCKENNIHIISLTENLDTSTPQGYFFFTMSSAFAQLERETTSLRVKASVPIRAKAGKPLGGQGIFGYKWESIPGDERHKSLVLVPEEASVRALLYQLFIKHRHLKTVARMLNERGLRTRKNGLFSDTTVRRLIEDTTAKGLHLANYTRSKGNKKSWELKPKEEWVEISVEPIISKEIWEKANQILKENHRKQVTKPRTYLLSGLVYCEMCGTKMYGHPGSNHDSPKYICSKCKNKIKQAELEHIIIQELTDHILQPKHINEAMEKQEIPLEKEIKETDMMLEQIKREIPKIENHVSKLMDDWIENKITNQKAFNEKVESLQDRKDQLKEEIPRVEAKLVHLRIQKNSREFVLEQAKSFTAMFSILDEPERKVLIERLLEKIIVGRDTINYNIYFLPEFHQDIPVHIFGNSQRNDKGS
ncbi:MAG: recombinase family protein [bacterium]|nr:recombinase family protein [bacterium]